MSAARCPSHLLLLYKPLATSWLMVDSTNPVDMRSPQNVVGKIVVTVFRKQAGNGAPTILDLASCFCKRASTGFDGSVAL
jgi:hypothetical protein